MLNVVQTNGYADSTATTESPNRTDFFSLHGSHVKAKQGAPSLGREMTGHPEHELTCTLMFVTLKLMNWSFLVNHKLTTVLDSQVLES